MATAIITTASGGNIKLTDAFLIRDTVIGKLANGEEKQFPIEENDTVVFG